MENKGKLNVQCSPGTFQKVQTDEEYRKKVVEEAAGNNYDCYDEIILSQCDGNEISATQNMDENEISPTQNMDNDFIRRQRTYDSDMADESQALNIAAGCSNETPLNKIVWLDAPTKFLLAKVKELLPKVGKSVKVKSKKHMWGQISDELRQMGYPVTWLQVEAKFFALERRYKNVQLNNSRTGRSRQVCPYQKELDDVLQNKAGISPEYLIDNEVNKKTNDESDESSQTNSESLDSTPTCSRKRGKTTIDVLYEFNRKQEKRDEELKHILEENMKQKKINAEKRIAIEKEKLNEEYRKKVVEEAAGNNYDCYDEIILSQCDGNEISATQNMDENEISPTQNMDNDFIRRQRTYDSDMADESQALNIAAGCSNETPLNKIVWLDAPTKFLLAKVKELLPKVGKSVKVKSKKHMWGQISDELRQMGYPVTWLQVEAKFFALERRYKNVQLNNSRTGRSRQVCPYQKELDDVLQNKAGISPEYLIDNEVNKKTNDESDESSQTNSESLDSTPTCSRKRGKTTIDVLYEFNRKQEKRDEELKHILEENMKQKKINAEKRIAIEKEKLSMLGELINVLKK